MVQNNLVKNKNMYMLYKYIQVDRNLYSSVAISIRD